MTVAEYRMSHQDAGHGSQYEQMYDHGYYRYIWTDVERPLLDEVLRGLAAKTGGEVLVDLACGTGRVTAVGADHFKKVVGLDISEDMLKIARQCRTGHPNVHFVRGDMQDGAALGDLLAAVGEASCMTAFRLFTNADPSLRRAAGRLAYDCLREGGVLVANSHMTPGSPVGAVYRIEHSVRSRLGHEQRMFNKVLAPESLRDLLLSCGFARAEIRPYAAFPGIPKLWRLVPSGIVERVERRFGGRTWNQCALVIAEK